MHKGSIFGFEDYIYRLPEDVRHALFDGKKFFCDHKLIEFPKNKFYVKLSQDEVPSEFRNEDNKDDLSDNQDTQAGCLKTQKKPKGPHLDPVHLSQTPNLMRISYKDISEMQDLFEEIANEFFKQQMKQMRLSLFRKLKTIGVILGKDELLIAPTDDVETRVVPLKMMKSFSLGTKLELNRKWKLDLDTSY